MNQALLIYGLRIISAIILLTFIATIAWLIYQDLRSAQLMQEQKPNGYLRVMTSGNSDLELDMLFPLLPLTSIGRANDNTIVIRDSFVSSHHALITFRERQWWLEDLGSRNGTLLNDLPVNGPIVISRGDLIVLGGTKLRIEPEL